MKGATKISCCLLAALLYGVGARKPITQSHSSQSIHVDATSDFRLSQKKTLTVRFYRRGPIPSATNGQPNEYVRGVVMEENGDLLDRWEARPTTIPTFYRRLNTARTSVDVNHILITVAVQYGGRSLELWALIWNGRKIRQIQQWTGQDFSLRTMGPPPRLVVIVFPADYNQTPDLYAWDGSAFRMANDAYPHYFSELGAKEALAINELTRNLPAEALVESCRRSLQAYARAGESRLGREACERARERIRTGQGLIPGVPNETKETFQRERRSGIAQIDRLLRSKG